MAVALVTGASRGIGRGIASALAAADTQVFATGRTIESADLPLSVRRLACDHRDDAQTTEVFSTLWVEAGRIDVLVNAAWGGYERMIENGKFTWGLPFWRQPLHRWDSMMGAGVRAAYVASALAAPRMIEQRSGLIVNLSFWAAQRFIGNTLYGVAKAATDKLTADIAHELKPYNVAALSLYPGLVRTESVLEAAKSGAFDLSNSESPEFIGRVIDALVRDPTLMARSGKVVVAAQAARELGVFDIDGKSPAPLSLDTL
ncbi:MAG: SDR family NAD(P)-dependent oxidoreductase [Alphaproteobacteria bacterium]